MSAKKMFEELGYEQIIHEGTINYIKNWHCPNVEELISFCQGDAYISYSNKGYNIVVSSDLSKAITKQLEELEWD